MFRRRLTCNFGEILGLAMMATLRTSSSKVCHFPHIRSIALIVLTILTAMSGCGPKSGSPYKLDRTVAFDSMKLFLETWRDNGSLAVLKDRTPSIVGKDADWSKGVKLLSFTIPSDGEDDGTNLLLDVQLNLETSTGEKRQKTIRYIIGTEPVVSIFRDD